VKEFFILLLIMETALIGVFIALDLFLFYFFWESTLIPMALLIGVFGHEHRVYAAVKFFLYTMLASVFMLAAILWLYAKTGSFDFCCDRECNSGRPGSRIRRRFALAVPRLLRCFRGEGSFISGAHMAARCTR
jgi:NADH:ubiquinone oxidoreductase subunit 4 (subunit M)